MLEINVPGRGVLKFSSLVLDYNGTIALDGHLLPKVEERMRRLAQVLRIFVLTADTFGTVREQCAALPVEIHVLMSSNHTQEKGDFLQRFLTEEVIAIGNGTNDQAMLQAAGLGILILGPEGCSVEAFHHADVLVRTIEDALDLLIYPKRLIATLRR